MHLRRFHRGVELGKLGTMQKSENHLAISILANPRQGFVKDLLREMRDRGCEVEDCRFSPLGDQLTANILLSGSWAALGKIETAMPAICEKLKMKAQFHRCGQRDPMPELRPYAVEVIAPEQLDLLLNILEFFAGQGVHITEIATQKYQANYTDASMASVHLIACVPVTHHPQALRENFMDLCDDLNADGLMDPVKS